MCPMTACQDDNLHVCSTRLFQPFSPTASRRVRLQLQWVWTHCCPLYCTLARLYSGAPHRVKEIAIPWHSLQLLLIDDSDSKYSYRH